MSQYQYIDSTPAQDGFWMPGEHEPHEEVWLGWPERTDSWQWGAKPAQQAFVEVANTIVEFTPVTVAVPAAQFENARQQLKAAVRVVEMSLNDSWFRDTGPTYVVNKQGERRAVSWEFNAWGGLVNGLYFPWDKDNQVAEKIANMYRDQIYQAPFVLEGGSVHCDGDGTAYTTKECLLHPGRNPDLTQKEIEAYLKDYLGVEKVIWLELGLFADEDTNGHVDNIMHVVKPGEVILSWCDDESDPQYAISQAAYELLSTSKDAKGRDIIVHKMPIPGPLYITEQEGNGFDACAGMDRAIDTRLAGSYANFLITNNLVIYPCFEQASDQQAQQIFEQCFPEHAVIGVAGRNILLGGGNIHCITQQIPLV